MGNFSTPLIKKTKEYVAGFIADNFTEKICYHNIDHTLEVVEASEFIGNKLKISKEDLKRILNRLKLETDFPNEKSHIHICFNPDYLFPGAGGTTSGQPGGYSKEGLRILPPFFKRRPTG